MRILNIILALLIVAATFGLFFIIGSPNHDGVYSNMFFANLAITVVLEILLMGSLFYITSDENYRLSTITASWVVFTYVILMALWMLCFGLYYYLSAEPLVIGGTWVKIYFGGLLALSVIFIGVLIFVTQGGYNVDELNNRTRHYVTENQVDNVDYKMMKFTFQRYMTTKHADSLLLGQTNRELDMFIEKTSTIPAYILQDNYRLANAINSQADRIRRSIDQMERIGNPVELNKEIMHLSQTLRTAINQIDTLRV